MNMMNVLKRAHRNIALLKVKFQMPWDEKIEKGPFSMISHLKQIYIEYILISKYLHITDFTMHSAIIFDISNFGHNATNFCIFRILFRILCFLYWKVSICFHSIIKHKATCTPTIRFIHIHTCTLARTKYKLTHHTYKLIKKDRLNTFSF